MAEGRPLALARWLRIPRQRAPAAGTAAAGSLGVPGVVPAKEDTMGVNLAKVGATLVKGAKRAVKGGAKPVEEAKAEPKAKATKEAKPKPEPKAAKPTLDATVKHAIVEQVEAEIAALSRRACACGCGLVGRGTFRPGHDAKLRSRLIMERMTVAINKGVTLEDVEVLAN